MQLTFSLNLLQNLKDSLAGDPQIAAAHVTVCMSTFFPSKHLLLDLLVLFLCSRQLSSGLENSPVKGGLLLERTVDGKMLSMASDDLRKERSHISSESSLAKL